MGGSIDWKEKCFGSKNAGNHSVTREGVGVLALKDGNRVVDFCNSKLHHSTCVKKRELEGNCADILFSYTYFTRANCVQYLRFLGGDM